MFFVTLSPFFIYMVPYLLIHFILCCAICNEYPLSKIFQFLIYFVSQPLNSGSACRVLWPGGRATAAARGPPWPGPSQRSSRTASSPTPTTRRSTGRPATPLRHLHLRRPPAVVRPPLPGTAARPRWRRPPPPRTPRTPPSTARAPVSSKSIGFCFYFFNIFRYIFVLTFYFCLES